MLELLLSLAGLVLIVVGGLNCFCGYRIFILFLQLLGFLIGAAIGGVIGLYATGALAAGVIGGLAGGVICVNLVKFLYEWSIFFIGFLIGCGIALLVLFFTDFVMVDLQETFIAAVGILCGVLARAVEKFIIIASTSVSGAWLAATGASFFWVTKWEFEALILATVQKLVLFAALALAGIIVQYRYTQHLGFGRDPEDYV